MQTIPLGRPDLAVRVGKRVVYPQNAQMMYSNLRFDRETKLNLISDYVDRSRAQPQPVPPIATGIPPAPAAIPPAPAAIPPIPPDTLMGQDEEEVGAPASLHYDSDSDSGDTPLQSLPTLNDEESDEELVPDLEDDDDEGEAKIAEYVRKQFARRPNDGRSWRNHLAGQLGFESFAKGKKGLGLGKLSADEAYEEMIEKMIMIMIENQQEADELYVPFDESAEPSTPQQGEAGSSTDPLPPNTGERSPFKRVMDTFQRRNNRVVPE